ncbi:MAG TPA: hypothetical protein VHX60_02950 [Acidobacteriaceae bacterium]|jgi:hypothetical protein|nr:hypothetical protein [Acidobacteriaceae bacterium]
MATIDQKIAQLYAALSEMHITDELASIEPVTRQVGERYVSTFDLNAAADQATSANRVTVLLNNIACLKDYLKVWCKRDGKTFTGDTLINGNKDVAIIHDLWNTDKHAEVSGSRSGLFPQLREAAAPSLTLRGGGGLPDAMATIQMVRNPVRIGGFGPAMIYANVRVKSDPKAPPILLPMHPGGYIQTRGDVGLRISAMVVDKDGNPLGDLEAICLRAVAAWEAEFMKAGLKLLR